MGIVLEETNLLFITGDKAIGKSSTVQAGVIPKYLQYNKKNNSTHYEALEIQPSSNPFGKLLEVIKKLCKSMDIEEKYNEVFLEDYKMFKPIMVDTFLKHIFKTRKVKLFLYVDNVEELLVLVNREDEELFLDTLLYLFQHQTEKFKVQILFSQREEEILMHRVK